MSNYIDYLTNEIQFRNDDDADDQLIGELFGYGSSANIYGSNVQLKSKVKDGLNNDAATHLVAEGHDGGFAGYSANLEVRLEDDDAPYIYAWAEINSVHKQLLNLSDPDTGAGLQLFGGGASITWINNDVFEGNPHYLATEETIATYVQEELLKVKQLVALDGSPVAVSTDNAGAVTIPVSLTLATGVTVDDVDNTPANDPTALITSQGVYNHTNATSNVHGLPSGAYVLGNKVGAGQFVESGTNNMSSASTNVTLSSSNSTGTCTFPVAFGSAPIVVATAQDRALAFLGVSGITTSQFSWRWITNATASVTVTIGYIAIGS